MNTKLDSITTQYRKFNENQALTEGQLNEFIDYFEDQDRLSRTRLSGVGVVCGFKSINPKLLSEEPESIPRKVKAGDFEINDFNSITITQGAAVTTDGDLITLRRKDDKSKKISIDFENNNYTHYREYIDKLNYPHFFKRGRQMPLAELFTLEEYNALVAQGNKDLQPISKIGKLSDKIIILYLESYSNEESPCQDADCDNQGAEQVSNLKVLLTDLKSIDIYMVNGDAKDSIYKLHNSYETLYDALPNIEAKRVILDSSITTASQLKAVFQNAIQTYNIISDLSDGFTVIASTFNTNLGLGSQTLNDKLNILLNTTGSNLDDYQYRYDLLKDLIDTYNEIKELILHLKAECCPDIASFPKHIMLGTVGAPQGLGVYTRYRHDFYNSPINTNDDENYERVLLLVNRFIQMIQGFQSFSGAIKIIPSNINVPVGDKALPIFYNVTPDLLKTWNFEKTQVEKEAYNLSYHTANLASKDFVQHPLLYNIDNNDFFIINGFLGMPYKAALQIINDLKKQYSLPIDVITLVLKKGEKAPDPIEPGTIAPAKETTVLSIKALRDQLSTISSAISNEDKNTQNTLQTISSLDNQLRLLNAVEYSTSGDTSILKENPKEADIVSELLSEFLERKTGVEHLGGVMRGGTFLLVYGSEADNKVLADFALPYLCCSKKDPVFLVLPASKLCQNDVAVPMTIIPLDGEIKAFVNGTQISNVITQSGGQNFFNPSLVNAQYFGQSINFTVNDDPVDTQMMVYAQPSVTVTVDSITYTEDPTKPTADVVFKVVSNAGLDYSWNFGDGKPLENTEPANGLVLHKYNLVVNQEDIFHPTITVTNSSGCSFTYTVAPLALIGQTTAICLAEMEIVVRYSDNANDPCGGGHSCDRASFKLKGNGVEIGDVFLNNGGGTLDHHNYPPGVTSGGSRYSLLPQITTSLAQQIAAISPDGFITFSLECALPIGCHTGTAWTTFKLNGNTIYEGCPNNNFLTINPCTGETR